MDDFMGKVDADGEGMIEFDEFLEMLLEI